MRKWWAMVFGRLATRRKGRRLAEVLDRALRQGGSCGSAISEVMQAVVQDGVEATLREFSPAPVAIFINRLREAVGARLVRLAWTGRKYRWGAHLAPRLTAVAKALHSPLVEQHLVNCVLAVSGLYAEVLTLDASRLDGARLAEAVTRVLQQSLSTVLDPDDFTVRLQEMTPTPPRGSGRGWAATGA